MIYDLGKTALDSVTSSVPGGDRPVDVVSSCLEFVAPGLAVLDLITLRSTSSSVGDVLVAPKVTDDVCV